MSIGMIVKTGEKIKDLRKLRGHSQQSLAEQVGMTKGYLSKIERRNAPPPFSTLEKMAAVLGVDVSELLDKTASKLERNIDFLSGERAKTLPRKNSDTCIYKPMLKSYSGKQMSPFMMLVNPGRTETFTHDSEEFVYIVSGSIDLEYNGERHEFEAGDSFYLDSRLPHTFVNRSQEITELLAVDYNYRRF